MPCEYHLAVDGYNKISGPTREDGSRSIQFVPKTERKVILEIYHGDDKYPEMEHQLHSIKRVEGNVSVEELIECVNDYLDMYINPCR
jgi:hypothetical protein